MTTQLRFAVLVDSEMPATDLVGAPLLSRERGADRLSAALAALGHDVTSEEVPLALAPPDRWVLYLGRDPEEALRRCGARRSQVEERLVIMDENRVSAAELMETLAVPLVVTSRSYRNWLSDTRTYAQVLGRPTAARALGIGLPIEDATKGYAEFAIPGVPLPEGIARYLRGEPLNRIDPQQAKHSP